MFGSGLMEQGKAMVAATASAWMCPCWDCRGHRRRLVRLAVMGALALGCGGGAAWELGRRHLSAARPAAGALEVVAAAAATAPLVPGAWDT